MAAPATSNVQHYPPGTTIAKPDHLFKILMIGESGVGKSALLSRFVDGNFEPNFISTIGVDFKIHYMKMDNKDIKLQVWDTAGQERFRTITTSYYRGANGIMIVFDVTDPASFEKVRYWLSELKEHVGADMPALLVGNKIDLTRERTVDSAAAKRFATEVGIRLRETSAKTADGVADAFTELVSMMLAKKIADLAKSQKEGAPAGSSGAAVPVGGDSGASSSGGCGCVVA
eukprot:m51a1_g8430 putative member ras oncogene family (230) ;mRNA; r:348101-349444